MIDLIKKCFLIGFVGCFFTLQADTLRPEKAFKPHISAVSDNSIRVDIAIEPTYYLYRQKRFSASAPELDDVNVALSAGSDKTDAFFGTQSVWYGGKDTASVTLAYDNPQHLKQTTLKLTYQGCHDGVLCYPPQRISLPVTLPSVEAQSAQNQAPLLVADSAPEQSPSETPAIAKSTAPAFSKSASPFSASASSNNALFPKQEQPLLREEQAFPPVVEPVDATTLQLHFGMVDGYYLYRDKLKIHVSDNDAPDGESPLANISLSASEAYHDDFKGEQSIYRGDGMVATIYLKRPVSSLTLDLTFQGCAEGRICYPVMRRHLNVTNGFVSTNQDSSPKVDNKPTANAKAPSNGGLIADLLNTLTHNLWAGVGLLLLAGIALSFTPCVLPMLPILSGIITNQRSVSKPRAFLLASSYGLGVATMMAVVGLVVAKTGINLQIIFQQPLWLIAFASVFIAMGLAMLGVFSIAMPSGVQSRVMRWQNAFQNSNPASVFVVGALSTLVVGPCVAPPLIAVLAFISTTGDSVLGAVYLFALGAGMSLPLVVFASLIPTVPKTGALSRLVTRVLAMLMFGVGLWLLGRLLSGALSLALWGIFMMVLAWFFWQSGFVNERAKRAAAGMAAVIAVVGCTWFIGGSLGNSNPLKPLTPQVHLPFVKVNDAESLQKALQNSDKPVMLDVYADWCVSCQEVEHFTLTEPAVVAALQNYTLLKLDITDTTPAHRELLKQLNLIGPPAMLFFIQGKEQSQQRHIGPISAPTLLKSLTAVAEKHENRQK